MFIASKILTRTSMANRQFVRNYDAVKCGMPRNPIPWAERVIHGIIISCGILATPAYIATNIKHYRGDPE